MADNKNYQLESVEANEISDAHIKQSEALFTRMGQNILLQQGNWLELPVAEPAYKNTFDFGYLTGNSLALLGGGSREYTRQAQQAVIRNFAKLIDKDGYLFIDHRNFDFIHTFINLPEEKITAGFTFDYTVYYHGAQHQIQVYPAYISDSLIVLHYYDIGSKTWSKLDYFPIYEHEMAEILGQYFTIEKTFYDFGQGNQQKSMFVQYLAKRN